MSAKQHSGMTGMPPTSEVALAPASQSGEPTLDWEPEAFQAMDGFMTVQEMRHACERAAFMLRSSEQDRWRLDDVTLLLLAVARSLPHTGIPLSLPGCTLAQLEQSLVWVTNSLQLVSPAAIRLQLTHARGLAIRLLWQEQATA